jgi:DNA polymerase
LPTADLLAPLSTDPNAWCFIDVETRSQLDVTQVGAYRHNAAGFVTIVAYAIGEGEVQTWCQEDWASGRKLDWRAAPDDLRAFIARVERGEAWMVAWNHGFEWCAFNRGMTGWNYKVEYGVDAMVQASRSHLPSDLAGAAKAIGLTQKQTAGKALIKLFAVEGNGVTPQTHPEEWEQFKSYARDDVAAMRDVFFATMPLHRRMWEEYWASERINHRGVAVDLPFVRGAAALADRLMKTANADVERLTGGVVKTVRQNKALLDWIRYELRHLPEVDRLLTSEFNIEEDDEGERVSVPKFSLGRGLVEALIAYLDRLDETQGLTDAEWAVLQVLEVRLFGASATPAKYQKILDMVDADGRLKGQYVYCGAAATTRFSSKAVQIHNLSRDTVGSLDDEVDAIELITAKGAAAYEEVQKRWGYVGKVLSRLIRTAFIAPEGKTFVFTDLSSIEAIVCPWLTDDEDAEPLLEGIRANHADPSLPDMYRIQAGSMLGKDPFEVTKAERQSHGKTVQLACQFLGGKGSLFNMGRIYRVHFEDDEAQEIIDRWRDKNKWAMRFGHRLWDGALWCMENPGEPRAVGRVTLVYDASYLRGTLFLVLPNGDPLLYTGIAWRDVTSKDKETGEEKVETRLTVRKGRGISPLWAGEIVNNATQATAAALLRHALRELDHMGWPEVVMHTHDEITVQAPLARVDEADAVLLRVMTTRPDWAPGLPIAAEPTRNDWYTKTKG